MIFGLWRVRFPPILIRTDRHAYSDASWADVIPQRKSTLCYLIFCNNAVFSWKSTLSSVLAMSSAEAELIALCACAADIAYCRKLANELGFLQLRPTVVHEDNIGAKQLAESGNFKGRSKHYELRWRFLHHFINRGILSIKAVKRDLQLADVGTAPAVLRNLRVWVLRSTVKFDCALFIRFRVAFRFRNLNSFDLSLFNFDFLFQFRISNSIRLSPQSKGGCETGLTFVSRCRCNSISIARFTIR